MKVQKLTDSGKQDNMQISVGISSCLLGMKVRYDGGHKHDNFLTNTLGRYFHWVHVCPEVEMGMSIPRETIRLEGEIENPTLIGPKSATDYTAMMHTFNEKKLKQLKQSDLHGYILKKDSPSCGMERVRVYNKQMPMRKGIGLFARALMENFPLLPVEEEGRLNDARLRENFIERVFAHYRLHRFLNSNPQRGDVVKFHTQHKLVFMLHSQQHYREMGKLVADIKNYPLTEFLTIYSAQFMDGLGRKATTKKHTNVLQHILGYFKKIIDSDDKQELIDLIERYYQGYVPLVVPLTLFKHHLNRHPIPWLTEQVYLNPYPAELMLRNFV